MRKQQSQTKDKHKQLIPRELQGIVWVTVAVFLAIANFRADITGILGNLIRNCGQYLLGVGFWGVIIGIAGVGIRQIRRPRDDAGWRIGIGVGLGLVVFTLLCESVGHGRGGIVGELLGRGLGALIGDWGLWSVIAIGGVASWVCLMGMPGSIQVRRRIPTKVVQTESAPLKSEPAPVPVIDTDISITDYTVSQSAELREAVSDYSSFELPPLDLLEKPTDFAAKIKSRIPHLKQQAQQLEQTLASFNVAAKVINITPGPSVTRYELQPGEGVKIAKITALSRDISLKLAATDVRIEAPIPGKALVGIEVPNQAVEVINMRSIIEKTDFYREESKLVVAMGLTITGDPIIMDIAKMPHVLIAGATGSGKSVCINAIVMSILLKATPDDVRFLMIDPKKVELSLYDGIPHLLAPVVTNPELAAATLKMWALKEMERRYQEFAAVGVKHIDGYNRWVASVATPDEPRRKLPYIVVIIDELADLMMVASQEVETTICRLAQMSRATGIHLVIATQRPSVDVVTGLIKANIPSRVSFFLQSQIDSRTILDMPGAEKLLGKGDMLYSPVGKKPTRVQGIYVNEREIKSLVEFLKCQGQPEYTTEILEVTPLDLSEVSAPEEREDELYEAAKHLVRSTQYASTSYLQRKLRIGYNRAARLMDELESAGVIGQLDGEKKSRSVNQ